MKKITAFILSALLVLGLFTACAETTTAPESKPEGTTEAPVTTAAATESATEADSEEATTEEETVPPAETETTEGNTELPYDVLACPVAKNGDKTLEGYNVSGQFSFDQGIAYSESANSMFIFTNDFMEEGMLTATFIAPEGDVNDNGIVFGMEDDVDELYYYWEDGPAYYFLFVSDDCSLYLAKVSFYGNPWEPLDIVAIPDYQHGDEITISVEYNGFGDIFCYANGELLISYCDMDYLTGNRYGFRCEVPGVAYTRIIAEPED